MTPSQTVTSESETLVAERVAERPPSLPDHTQLPSEDGTFVKNFQEHPQSIILTDSIGPILEQIHPDGDYAIGQDCGIYWRETAHQNKVQKPQIGFTSPVYLRY